MPRAITAMISAVRTERRLLFWVFMVEEVPWGVRWDREGVVRLSEDGRPSLPVQRRAPRSGSLHPPYRIEHLYQSGPNPARLRAMSDDPLSLLAAGATDLGELAVEGSLRPRTLDEYI